MQRVGDDPSSSPFEQTEAVHPSVRPVTKKPSGIRLIDRLVAGADADVEVEETFHGTMATLAEFEAVRAAVDVPLLANLAAFGADELFTVEQLQNIGLGLGINMVIWPESLLRLAMTTRCVDSTRASRCWGNLQLRAQLYKSLDYEIYNCFDDSLANFRINQSGR